jgi:hypothetical protein
MEADSLQTGIAVSAVISVVMRNVPAKECCELSPTVMSTYFTVTSSLTHTVQYSAGRHCDTCVCHCPVCDGVLFVCASCTCTTVVSALTFIMISYNITTSAPHPILFG